MANRFFDASAAVKHYRGERGSARVDAFLAEVGSRHYISALCVVEFHSVLPNSCGLVSSHRPPTTPSAIGLWQVVSATPDQFDEAQQLIARYGMTRALYPQDAYHLAVALLLHRRSPLDAFVSADTNLCAFAAAGGLIVVNPEIP